MLHKISRETVLMLEHPRKIDVYEVYSAMFPTIGVLHIAVAGNPRLRDQFMFLYTLYLFFG